jgi:hypothetical protein
MKKKQVLYSVELHGQGDTRIFLVTKDIYDWILNGGDAPEEIFKAWKREDLEKLHHEGSGSSSYNDRALSMPADAAKFYSDSTQDYARWYARNKNKYIVRDGLYGYIY